MADPRDGEIARLRSENAELRSENAELRSENAELRAQVTECNGARYSREFGAGYLRDFA